MNNNLTDSFVDEVFKICSEDKAARARLRRADNPAFEWQALPVVYTFIKDGIDDGGKRHAYLTVAAAIARSDMKANGSIGLGEAFRLIEEEKKNAEKPKTFPPRLSRLMSCDSLEELVMVIRPILSLVLSKLGNLDFKRLLRDLLDFRYRKDSVLVGWAKDYMGNASREVLE